MGYLSHIFFILGKGNKTYPDKQRALCALCNEVGFLWNLMYTVLHLLN